MISRPSSCSGCPLDPLAYGFSLPEGQGTSGVMIIGEALGDKEVRDGLPFRPDAQAGSVLQKAIERSGFFREEFVIYNIVNCQPPGNILEGAVYEQGAAQHCRIHLDQVVARFQPRVIYALGNIPIKYLTGLTGPSRGSTSLRGFVIEGTRYPGIPVVAGLHPAYIARGARQFTEVLRRDLIFARAVARKLSKTYQERYKEQCVCTLPIFTGEIPHEPASTCRYCNGKGFIEKIRETPLQSLHADYLFVRTWEEAIAQGLDYRKPSPDEARADLARLSQTPPTALACDIETEFIRKRNKSEMVADLKDKIISFQYSDRPGFANYLPWVEPYISIIKELLILDCVKVGHNSDAFDWPILEAAGCEIKGERFDTMNLWHHLQPDLLKDLQFVASMFGFPFPWDHLKGSQPELYACADPDATIRVFEQLPAQMKQMGVWDSYLAQVRGLRPVLDRITVRGLPISDEKLDELAVEFDGRLKEISERCQELWPERLRKYHPEQGYKIIPMEIRKAIHDWTESRNDGSTPDNEEDHELCEQCLSADEYVTRKLGYIKHEFCVDDPKILAESSIGLVERWCKPLPFLPNSVPQVKSYIKFKGHSIPKNFDGVETTGMAELKRLAKKTKDPLYPLVVEYRKIGKIRNTYVGGNETQGFRPEPDGRVRAYFTYNTGTGQLATSGGPPLLTIPKHDDPELGLFLAKKFRGCFVAEPGHSFVELDFSAFHALTLGFEAEDSQYMRLARLDPHSYVAAHMLKLPGCEYWLEKPDDELRELLGRVKQEHREVRDQKAKRTILGRGFGMGARKCFALYMESFSSEREVKGIFNLLDALFPKTFVDYPKRIRDFAHRQHYLVSRYGYIRWFWEVYKWDGRRGGWTLGGDAEAAIAYFPANDAFGVMRDVKLEMSKEGLDDRYELANVVHDAFWFHCPDKLIEECVRRGSEIMMRPSPKLVSSVAPEGLWCGVEASVGKDLASMEKIAF